MSPGLLALVVLASLSCAKGQEIAEGEIAIFRLDTDAGAGAAGTGGGANLPEPNPTASPTASTPSPPPAQSPSAAGDAGATDAGRSEDRPADAGD